MPLPCYAKPRLTSRCFAFAKLRGTSQCFAFAEPCFTPPCHCRTAPSATRPLLNFGSRRVAGQCLTLRSHCHALLCHRVTMLNSTQPHIALPLRCYAKLRQTPRCFTIPRHCCTFRDLTLRYKAIAVLCRTPRCHRYAMRYFAVALPHRT